MMQHLHRRFLTPCRKVEWEILKRIRMDLTPLIMSFILHWIKQIVVIHWKILCFKII